MCQNGTDFMSRCNTLHTADSLEELAQRCQRAMELLETSANNIKETVGDAATVSVAHQATINKGLIALRNLLMEIPVKLRRERKISHEKAAALFSKVSVLSFSFEQEDAAASTFLQTPSTEQCGSSHGQSRCD